MIEHPRHSEDRGGLPGARRTVEEKVRKLALLDCAQKSVCYLCHQIITGLSSRRTSSCAAMSPTSLGLYFSTHICAFEEVIILPGRQFKFTTTDVIIIPTQVIHV